jgi:hypothetical protein
MEVRVDNIDGSIQIVGHTSRTVNLIVNKTIRAESNERIQTAKEEVQLLLNTRGEVFEAYVDAPWRSDDGRGHRGRGSSGYRVSFDFELRVPVDAELYLRTINNGEITVEDVSGDFDVNNINGGIEMTGIGGSGRAYALNGELEIQFSRNPEHDSYFGSLNGDVDVFFLPGLEAEFQLKTFNGDIYSDFPVTYLPGGGARSKQEGGKFVYKANKFFGVQVGNGGPEIKLDGFNGDIRIHDSSK